MLYLSVLVNHINYAIIIVKRIEILLVYYALYKLIVIIIIIIIVIIITSSVAALQAHATALGGKSILHNMCKYVARVPLVETSGHIQPACRYWVENGLTLSASETAELKPTGMLYHSIWSESSFTPK